MFASSIPDFGPYNEIEKKIIQSVLASKIDDKIFTIIQTKYEEELTQRNIILSRPNRNRLFKQVVKTVLNEILGKLGE